MTSQIQVLPTIDAYRSLVDELVKQKRSKNTQRAYHLDLRSFFEYVQKSDQLDPEQAAAFFQKARVQAMEIVLQYRALMLGDGLSEATVNRRMSAIKSLAKYAKMIGRTEWDLNDLEGEKVKSYRDTKGVGVEAIQKLLKSPDRQTIKGKRDYAIMRLLWECALRRDELVKITIADVDLESGRVAILGKGRGTQKEWMSISDRTKDAITDWMMASGDRSRSAALFIPLDRATKETDKALTGQAIYNLIKQIATQAGVKAISPHQIRHSSITAALDATDGNVRKVIKLSRHSKIETLMIYDDNRVNVQSQVTNLLSELA
jgi:integrase/recombinase XerC